MPIAEGDAQQALVDLVPQPPRFRCLCGFEIEHGWEPLAVTTALDAVAEHVRFDCPKVQRAAPPKWPGAAEKMTLGELEALAERYGKAVSTIKEAQALFAGPVSAPAASTAPAGSLVAGVIVQPLAPGGLPPRPPTRFVDAEAAADLQAFHQSQERQRLVEQNRDNPANFPPGIANAMRGG